MTETIPTAVITSIHGPYVWISCPYCGRQHRHELATSRRRQRERRAPGCGLTATPKQRLDGYYITTTERRTAA